MDAKILEIEAMKLHTNKYKLRKLFQKRNLNDFMEEYFRVFEKINETVINNLGGKLTENQIDKLSLAATRSFYIQEEYDLFSKFTALDGFAQAYVNTYLTMHGVTTNTPIEVVKGLNEFQKNQLSINALNTFVDKEERNKYRHESSFEKFAESYVAYSISSGIINQLPESEDPAPKLT